MAKEKVYPYIQNGFLFFLGTDGLLKALSVTGSHILFFIKPDLPKKDRWLIIFDSEYINETIATHESYEEACRKLENLLT